MPNIAERLEEIAKGCDDCASDNDQEHDVGTPGAKGEARAWRATAAMIRAVIADLGGPAARSK